MSRGGGSSGGKGAQIRAFTDVDVQAINTIVNTDLASLAVPQNVLNDERLHCVVAGEILNNSGAGCTYTFTVLLGATALAVSSAINQGTNPNPYPFTVDVWVAVVNALNAQRSIAALTIGNSVAGSGWGAAGIAPRIGVGTAAEDLTVGKLWKLQCQMSVANAAASITAHMAHLEHVPKP